LNVIETYEPPNLRRAVSDKEFAAMLAFAQAQNEIVAIVPMPLTAFSAAIRNRC
jgi:hypothetical protein